MKKTPVSLVKERFESKEKLVAAVQKLATQDLWLDRVSAAKGLGRVSNAKLVRLHDTLSDAKKRVKDKGFASKLAAYPLPQLLDLHAAAERASKREAKAPAVAKAAKAEKPKAAAAKAAPKAAAKAAPKASAKA